MKICASTYSFGKYCDRGINFMIDQAAEMGFDGIEVVLGCFDRSTDLQTAREVRGKCASRGLVVASVCTGAELIRNDVKEEVRRLCEIADLTATYGAPLMRHDVSRGFPAGTIRRSYHDALPILAPACREVASYAASVGVISTTENHGYFSQDAARVEKLICAVGHENFGALVDVGNFMCADEDPNLSVGLLAPYARHVHAKDFYFRSGGAVDPGEGWFRSRGGNYLKGTIIGHGDARAAQSLGVLKRAGYDGWISVEFEGMEDNLTGLRIGRDNVLRFWNMH